MKISKKVMGIICILIVLILLAVILFVACGGSKRPVSKRVIKEDLLSSDEWSDRRPMYSHVDDIEVTKRQTRKESGIDTIWVNVSITIYGGEIKTKDMPFKMVYNLYNDGWRLEEVTYEGNAWADYFSSFDW